LTAQQRGYTYRWSQISQSFLARFPLCGMRADGRLHDDHSECVQGRLTKAAECVDHIVPRAQGGTDREENLQALCNRCNTIKGIKYEGGFPHARR
jgi:5-methylcytosine-specific restriction protein A